ncbi:GAF domain-containing protein, partial [Kitasatospora nipponensis]|uniref:GAF domain-containing protein n=1 Tax=Kitasatospora nipponensis TaxID=258049 RepID=UPI0031D0BF74
MLRATEDAIYDALGPSIDVEASLAAIKARIAAVEAADRPDAEVPASRRRLAPARVGGGTAEGLSERWPLVRDDGYLRFPATPSRTFRPSAASNLGHTPASDWQQLPAAHGAPHVLSAFRRRSRASFDLHSIAVELCEVLVRHVADFACVDLLDRLISDAALPGELPDNRTELRRVARAFNPASGQWDHVLDEGALLTMPASTPPGLALQENKPVLVPTISPDVAVEYAISIGGPELVPVVAGRSMLVLPLSVRGTVLGILKLLRLPDRPPFEGDDVAELEELAAWAALSLDNARLHRAESKVATTLQRSMIPTRPPRIPGVQIAHRYMPGDRRAEVGG